MVIAPRHCFNKFEIENLMKGETGVVLMFKIINIFNNAIILNENYCFYCGYKNLACV